MINFIFLADPTVSIAEHVIFVEYGSDVQIRATTYTSSQSDFTIDWYHGGIAVNTTASNHYSVVREGIHVYTLSVSSVDPSRLGIYEVVVTVNGRNQSDIVQLMLPGKDI